MSFPRKRESREPWIPAYAGMTPGFLLPRRDVGGQVSQSLSLRKQGNDTFWTAYRVYFISILCLLVGCALFKTKEKPFIFSFPYPGPPEKIWSTIKDVLVSYQIKSIVPQGEGALETEWKTVLGLGRYESTRSKVHLQLLPLEPDPKGQDRYVVKLWVEVQHNKNIAPIDRPELLKWVSAGSDSDEAKGIIWKLNFRLLDRKTLERYLKGQKK